MPGTSGSGRARRVDGSGQLALDAVPARSSAVAAASSPGQVVFCDPTPERIAVGSELLGAFLRTQGLRWVLEMRTILRRLDWSSYVARYKAGGRQPYHPAAMLGLILLGHMSGQTSLRQLEGLARTDLRAWWLTGGVMPDFTSLCRFVRRHQEDLTDATFEALTAKIVRLLASEGTVPSIDGTVVQAAASRWTMLHQEAAAALAIEAREAAAAAPQDKGLADKAKHAEGVHEVVQRRNAERVAQGRKPDAKVAPNEPEAMHQPLKRGAGYAPSYKPSAAANADRIITGKDVHPSNEVGQVEHMLAQTERVTGAAVDTALLDAGYNTAEMLAIGERRGIELLIPEGKATGGDESWSAARSKLSKDNFSFDAERDVYTCPQGRRLVLYCRGELSDGQPTFMRYRSEDCSNCPLADQCLRKGAVRRTIQRYPHEASKAALRLKMQQPEARKRYKQRQARIEPVHGEQKRVQGMTRFRRRGLRNVKCEYSLHCMAHNLRRFRVLWPRRRGGSNAGTPGPRTGRYPCPALTAPPTDIRRQWLHRKPRRNTQPRHGIRAQGW